MAAGPRVWAWSAEPALPLLSAARARHGKPNSSATPAPPALSLPLRFDVAMKPEEPRTRQRNTFATDCRSCGTLAQWCQSRAPSSWLPSSWLPSASSRMARASQSDSNFPSSFSTTPPGFYQFLKKVFERAAPTSADPKGQVVALMRPVMPQ